MNNGLFIGIDIGSVAVKTAVVSEDGHVLFEKYSRITGEPFAVLMAELSALFSSFSEGQVCGAGATGSGAKEIAGLLGACFTNEILAQAAFVERFYPDARTIIEMGGEDSKLISVRMDVDTGTLHVEDFAMNTACAAGTGSFLDQQASRLRLSIEEFSALALKSKNPPPVAGRCSVFAKSDMIHLQQIATPDYDIVAGLCFAMARNFKATLGKGKAFAPPVLFLGGVAANLGMQRAFREVLGIESNGLIVPEHFNTSAAIGAALIAMRLQSRGSFKGLSRLKAFLEKDRSQAGGRPRLSMPSMIMPNPDKDASVVSQAVEAYLGVDVGSVSTNVVVLDGSGRVLAKRYLPTSGRPIEAVKQGLAEVGAELGERVRICGVGTTGSGRYLTGDIIGADVIKNEITCQAAAAVFIDPGVDTIFEIGGQDSKYISIKHGSVVDFEMNKACAAGTGSFLEEQAERLGICIKDQFADLALSAAAPCGLGERCTVFMESDLVHYLNRGSGVENISAGLAYSIAQNYLNRVVAGRGIGNRIFFQGGVAANKAVVAAFEQILGKRVTVPPHHEVTGAVGAALIAMRNRPEAGSRFKGFKALERPYTVSTFTCRECANQCDIRMVRFGQDPPLFYGGRCEKYDIKRGTTRQPLDLFAERDRLLIGAGEQEKPLSGPVVGIPRMLYINDYLPFWKTFFAALGCNVVISGNTNRTIINNGLDASLAESCFPSKAGLGHIRFLIEKGTDFVFIPSFIRFPSRNGQRQWSQACPYAQAMPYMARAALSFGGARSIEPKLYLHDLRLFKDGLVEIAKVLGKNRRHALHAFELADRAQAEFHHALQERGREALSMLKAGEKALVLIGRSYNALDTGMNMNLPAKIRDLGVQAIPMDFLPLDSVDLSGWEGMYWRSGQRILAAARFIKDHPQLHPVYITNFGCGPDSFISHFFRREMNDRPFLQLEIDEHSADAGLITRIEAFLDTLKATGNGSSPPAVIRSERRLIRDRRVFIPAMSDHAHAFAAAFRACGVQAEVLPESDEESMRIGKEHSSGRECYPLALTVGDMIKATMRPDFDPDKSAFFMPAGKGPCRFGQYHLYHRHVLEQIGLSRVPIFSPMQDETMFRDIAEIDPGFVRMTWRAALAVDMLQKLLHEHRPYENERGESDRLYREALMRVVYAVEQRDDLLPVLRRAYHDFRLMGIERRSRPVIGIVGEIYIRSNRFGNEDIIRKIEDLGGEAWVAPVSEWLLYLTETSKRSARMVGYWKGFMKSVLTELAQHADERSFASAFDGCLRSLHEPKMKTTLALASPYIHPSFEGEAVLTIGKAIDYMNKGVAGIVNVMPLTCMPGTISSAVLKRVREHYGDVPLLTIAYDGQKDSQVMTRLEAFMHQARAYQLRSR